ncbi:hypothetical protein EW146_g10486, partial [Bondarzewia mesenterica]
NRGTPESTPPPSPVRPRPFWRSQDVPSSPSHSLGSSVSCLVFLSNSTRLDELGGASRPRHGHRTAFLFYLHLLPSSFPETFPSSPLALALVDVSRFPSLLAVSGVRRASSRPRPRPPSNDSHRGASTGVMVIRHPRYRGPSPSPSLALFPSVRPSVRSFFSLVWSGLVWSPVLFPPLSSVQVTPSRLPSRVRSFSFLKTRATFVLNNLIDEPPRLS